MAATAVPTAATMPTESAVLAAAMLGEPAVLTFTAALAFIAMLTELVMLKTAAPVAVIKTEQAIGPIGGVSAVGVPLTPFRASGARC
jgi:hypothetical protein